MENMSWCTQHKTQESQEKEQLMELERLDDASSSPAEGQIVVSLPTWENFDQTAASTRHSPISGSDPAQQSGPVDRQKNVNTHQT